MHTSSRSPRFFNRKRELAFLNRSTPGDRAALLVFYGRRRTGKTSLLRRFCQDRRAVFFVADMTSRADQLAAFSRVVFDALGMPELGGTSFPSWEAALRLLAARASAEPLVLVLDEFSYLCASDPSLPSVIQRLWDAQLRETRLHLVLCGSYVAFMENEVLGAKNPLYGRRTGEWLLEPFRFREATLFFPGKTPAELVDLYAVLGGIPAYLERFEPALPLRENVVRHVLSRGSPLYNEPRFLLMQELREPRTYFSICRAVALGRTTPNEIAQGAGLPDRGAVSRYLQTLRELRVLERRTPATERNPERTRRGRYRLADPFLRFWFRFVLPNVSMLETGDPQRVYDARVAPHLEQHVSATFEEVARQHLEELLHRSELPAAYDRVGGWWRKGAEVDVLAVADHGPLLLGECKWSRRPVGTNVLDALRAKVPAVSADLARSSTEVHFALWSRSGYTPALARQAAKDGDVTLFSLDDLGVDRAG